MLHPLNLNSIINQTTKQPTPPTIINGCMVRYKVPVACDIASNRKLMFFVGCNALKRNTLCMCKYHQILFGFMWQLLLCFCKQRICFYTMRILLLFFMGTTWKSSKWSEFKSVFCPFFEVLILLLSLFYIYGHLFMWQLYKDIKHKQIFIFLKTCLFMFFFIFLNIFR